MTEKTLTTENIKPALDALRGELAPWPVVAKKQDRLNTAQLNAANSGITSSLVAQIIANTAAIRALESAITGTGLRALVVSSLPAVGTLGILYIVPVTTYDPDTDADVVNYSNEYIWIVAPDAPVTEGYYEQVGQTGIVINNGQLTITVNGTSVGTFTANQSGDTTAAITVPTNADYVDKTTAQSIAGVKTFSDGIVGNVTGNVTGNVAGNVTGNVTGDLTGTASKAIADEDGTSIKTGYGKLAGNQTWTGTNSFNILSLYNNSVTYNQAPSSDVELPSIRIFGGGKYCGAFDYVWRSTGENVIRLSLGSYKSDGTFGYWACNFGVPRDFSNGGQFGTPAFYPNNNNAYSLGTSSYQWSSVYAQSYFYNGTAWGLDKSNVWTAHQKITGSNSRGILSIYNPAHTKGSATSTSELSIGTIFLGDGGATGLANSLGFISTDLAGNGAISLLSLSAMENTASSGTRTNVVIQYDKNDVANPKKVSIGGTVQPNPDATFSLGTSTLRWKTLNGVNPGALSLPDKSKATSIDTTNLVYGSEFTFTPTVSGWLFVSVTNCTIASLKTGVGEYYFNQSSGFFRDTVPVIAGEQVTLLLVSTATSAPTVTLYPCLGNV